MRKYIKYNLLGLALLALVIAGCDTASQEVAEVVSPDGYPTVTFETDASGTTYAEGDTIKYTMTLEKQLDRSVTFSARVIGGDATDADFTVSPAVVQPFTNSATLTIVINKDDANDPDETVSLEIGAFSLADKYLVHPDTENPVLDFTITNWESSVLQMTFGWDVDVKVNPNYEDYPDHINIHHAGSEMDFDIFLADADGYDNANPWATFNPVTYAATGSEPEELVFDGLDDGSYVIFCELWYNNFVDSATYYTSTVEDVPVPIVAHFLQSGVFEKQLVQDDSQVFTTKSPGVDNAEYAGEVVDTYVAEVTIAGDTYTIKDFSGATVKKGKVAGTTLQISKRPDYLRK